MSLLTQERTFSDSHFLAAETAISLQNIPNLKTTYSPGRLNRQGNELHFDAITAQIAEISHDVITRYEKQEGKDFDRFRLGNMADTVREWFWNDPRFPAVLNLLDIHHSQAQTMQLPWWNEVGLAEKSWNRFDGEVVLCPRHSYEAQAVRMGVQIPIKPIAIGGIIQTSPDNENPAGTIVVGLRGGQHFPNLFMLPAGGLQYSESLVTGRTSIQDAYVSTELHQELGLVSFDISSIAPHSRIDDRLIDKGIMYVFKVVTKLTSAELLGRWNQNKHEDQREHRELMFVSADKDKLTDFIFGNYRGALKNDPHRTDNNRYLLHQAALALAVEANISPVKFHTIFQATPR